MKKIFVLLMAVSLSTATTQAISLKGGDCKTECKDKCTDKEKCKDKDKDCSKKCDKKDKAAKEKKKPAKA